MSHLNGLSSQGNKRGVTRFDARGVLKGGILQLWRLVSRSWPSYEESPTVSVTVCGMRTPYPSLTIDINYGRVIALQCSRSVRRAIPGSMDRRRHKQELFVNGMQWLQELLNPVVKVGNIGQDAAPMSQVSSWYSGSGLKRRKKMSSDDM